MFLLFKYIKNVIFYNVMELKLLFFAAIFKKVKENQTFKQFNILCVFLIWHSRGECLRA
ncbi:hypothetical protein SEHO0A_03440 [Salmonella enterica subsp. houtenae str. ATCC BAA-1581]|nr:hypothetical protein SEHO0A_03440 [Salmonella enterica subsp. houtenae str. ATCC BAA-1581]